MADPGISAIRSSQPRRGWIALGANLGDRRATMEQAVRALDAHPSIAVRAVSPLYASEAHTLTPGEEQPDYFNAVAALTTTLLPEQLLDVLLALEHEAGRAREAETRWAPRPLDLDILHVEGVQRSEQRLTLPHPRMEERRFVLQPLADLAPSLYVPAPYDATVADLLMACPDSGTLRLVATSWADLVADVGTDDPMTDDLHGRMQPPSDALSTQQPPQQQPLQQPNQPESPEPTDEKPADPVAGEGEPVVDVMSTPNEDAPIVLRDDLRYIAIEGVIGAGKTTLANLLAERFGGQLILEAFDENPFLPRFYADRARWAFQTQLNFLASRYRQQQMLRDRSLFHEFVITDYTFDKDRIFARQTLTGDELHLYESLYSIMAQQTPLPDLVVYLRAPKDRLMQHIARRGRSYEKDMDPAYIAQLADAYDQYFFHYTKSPLLIINTANIDFVKNPGDLAQLMRQVVATRHPGTTHFNPLPTEAPA